MTDKLKALNEGPSYEFFGNDNPKCPHCGNDFDVQENEAWFLYDENDTHDVECPICDHSFLVNSMAKWTFSTDEQDE